MSRRVFFSFHYTGDVCRIGIVRNSWVTKKDRDDAGFWDAADWETVRKDTDLAIKRWINAQLKNTSVTVVLIGTDTSTRDWVNYEIEKSIEKGNGLLGIHINNIKGICSSTSNKGKNPLDNHQVLCLDGKSYPASKIYKTYDWVSDDGYNNLKDWIEEAAKIAGK
ncbi:TIR domain-containing protein [Providencia rettgeri]|uniref:TIR domain-containing protein n=1 Tax=Providencia sp. PROV092 TaxID=2949808 RepID=UPI002349C65D|nr:TIR domain-containing protein [Providencia sp. PROV092]EJD6043758.1 TIR domain-containing protein [Providencia rettgeri]ELR5126820.1 TIR domain-containing protein [Providencia rettgeri]ELR5243351.1 TIR domain-containing protein [Providencia rettgeri]ELR5257735.1 TIR domain-containing protein [Providencia rettgeri]ELS4585011.1 TIR domain-containing protein [Providencia rettgeri]